MAGVLAGLKVSMSVNLRYAIFKALRTHDLWAQWHLNPGAVEAIA